MIQRAQGSVAVKIVSDELERPTNLGTARGFVRRIDDLGRVVIPKEIRRTLRIREGDPLDTTLTPFDRFCMAIHSIVNKYKNLAR